MESSRSLRRLLGAAAGALLLCHTAATQAVETIRLTAVAGHPPVLLWVKHLKETLIPTVDAELAKGGKYKIQWTEGYAGSIAKVGEELEAIESGLADIGHAWSLFDPAKLPLQNVGYVAPFNSDDSEMVADIVEMLQRKVPAMGAQWDKYNQVYLGAPIASDSYHLWTTFPIKRLEDMNGRKIGGPAPALNWLKGTGAVGVSSDLTRYYNDIKSGVYDGAALFVTSAFPQRLYEAAPHMTRVSFGTGFAGGITFNKPKWEKLPDEVKKAIRAGVAALKSAYYKEQTAREAAWMKAMQDKGMQVYTLPAEERRKWAKAIPNVAKEWAQTQEKKGLPGKAVLKGFMEELRARGANPPRDWDKE